MSADQLQKFSFNNGTDDLEVWVYEDRHIWEYRIEVRKDAAPVVFVNDNGEKASFKYLVSFEVEVDSKMQSTPSPLAHMISTAKSDAGRFKVEKVAQNG
ncbi:hypothetical protein [Sphingomonas sp.]|uniref:hypothetical protein n=1 Tax=Sphingomonas sp. TaxID=28214 RepID=UPI00286D10B5|nr:hypothetical protein [Sphingomonas sp.]